MEQKDDFRERGAGEFMPNKCTKNLAIILGEILTASTREKKAVFLEGGFAIEIEAGTKRGDGRLTRNHSDLDIHPLEEDIYFWKKWFQDKGCLISANDEIRDLTKAFVAHAPGTKHIWDWNYPGYYYVDVYGVRIGDKGKLYSSESGEEKDTGLSWQDHIIACGWNDFDVNVVRHEAVLAKKRQFALNLNQPLRTKDIHDHKLFGADLFIRQ